MREVQPDPGLVWTPPSGGAIALTDPKTATHPRVDRRAGRWQTRWAYLAQTRPPGNSRNYAPPHAAPSCVRGGVGRAEASRWLVRVRQLSTDSEPTRPAGGSGELPRTTRGSYFDRSDSRTTEPALR